MPNTAEPARTLLDALSDDQLARYGEIARDQARAELERWWVQGLLAVAAAVAVVWSSIKWGIAGIGAWGIQAAGFGKAVVLGLMVGAALAYGPYRRIRNWTLWRRHCKAVEAEQSRRRGIVAGRG